MFGSFSTLLGKTKELISDDDGEVNENGKKWQNNNFAHASLFWYISWPSLCRPNFTFCGGSEHKTTTSFFFSWTSIQSLEFNSRKSCQHLTNWTRWSKRKKRFAAARFHFLSVVFVAVAVFVAFKLSNIKYPLFSVESYKVATLKKRKQKTKTTMWQYINQTFTALVSELNS